MKNFTNNFKQFTSRLSARWLIMAQMMLVGTSSAWGAVVYYVDTNNWGSVYIHYWGGSGGSDWNGDQTMEQTNSKVFGFNVYSYDDFGDNNSFIFKKSKGDSNDGKTGDITGYTEAKPYYYDGGWYASISEIGIDYLEILKGNKIAFYIGEPSSWNQSKFYLRKNSTTKASTNFTFISGKNRLGVVSTAAETELYVTHDEESWQGEMINQAPVAGGAYLCDNGDSYPGCQNLNITALAYSFTLTKTTIKTGETCSITEGTKPTTYQGNSTSIRYFVKTDNTNFTEVAFQNGALQTGSLAVGTYTIRPLITDGIIYAIGTDKTLTVETACDKPDAPSITINPGSICSGDYATITASTVDGAISYSLYKGNNDAPAQTNNTGIFEVSEAASYRVTVTTCGESRKSSFVTLSKKTGPTASNYVIKDASKSIEYTGSEQTLTAEDITVNNNAGAVVSVYFKQDGNIVDPINVGDYEVYVTTAATEDICAGDIEIGTFEILCATATSTNFTISNTTFTYNGNKQTPTVTPKAGVGTATTTYKQGNTTVQNPTNAGTYDIYVTTVTGTSYCAITDPMKIGEFTIYKKDVSKEDYTMSPVEFTYNGEKQVPIITPESGVGIVRSTEYKLNNTTVVENPTDAGTYTVYISSDAGTNYKAASSLELGTFTIAKKAPSKTDFSYVGEKDYTGSTLSAEVEWIQNTGSGDIYTYYKVNGAADNTYTTTEPTAAGTYIVAVTTDADVNYAAATAKIELGEFVINCPSVAAPVITTTATICTGTQVTLSAYNNSNTVKWYSNPECTSEVTEQVTPTDGTKYYAKAYHEASGCYSSEYSTLTFTVNPLPTISIGDNTNAVKFEDVELTATGENIDKVEWTVNKGTITEDATDPTKAVLTYDQADAVIVTAIATSAARCTSTAATKTVTFGEEKCETGNTKILFSKEYGDYYGFNIAGGIYLYSYNKDTKTEYTGAYPGKEITNTEKINGIDYYVYEFKKNESTDKLAIVIRATYDYGQKIGKTKDIYLNKPGATYTIKLTNGNNATKQDYQETKKGSSDAYDVYIIDDNTTSTGGGITITAPAAKTISLSTTEGEGNIIFSGQVVKTGCDATNEYGFQYSTDRQNWTTVKVGENASAGTPFSDNSVKGLDGTYYIRAYITNDHSTQTSAEKEIRLQTSTDPISNVRIKLVDEKGGNNVPSAYCVGSTAYIKATYDGAKYTQFEWKSDQGITLTELGSIPDVFQFTVKGNDNIVLMLRNIYNREGEFFSNEQPLVVNATPEPTAPTISLDKSTLCSNDNEGATISLANTVVGQTYSLFKEIENGDDTQIGNDIECTEQNKKSISFNLKGLDVAGRYYVIAKENVCNRTIGTTSVTLEVVNTTGLSISIEPNTAIVTPWEPVKLKITATEGYQYNVTGLDGMVYTVNGDTYTVKIPLPEGGTRLDDDGNVIFAPIEYTISATLITGGDNQCILPATCTIKLTPYLEPCTQN